MAVGCRLSCLCVSLDDISGQRSCMYVMIERIMDSLQVLLHNYRMWLRSAVGSTIMVSAFSCVSAYCS